MHMCFNGACKVSPSAASWLRTPSLYCGLSNKHPNKSTLDPQSSTPTNLWGVDLRAAVSVAWRIARVAGGERVLVDGRVGAQELGLVQSKGALVCSFQHIPTGRSMIGDGHNCESDITAHGSFRKNDVGQRVLITRAGESSLINPVDVVGRCGNCDAGEKLKGVTAWQRASIMQR